MPRPGSGARPGRPPAEWAVRGVLAVVAAALGVASVSASLANVIVNLDPARAHQLAPGDGRITAALAQQQFALDPQRDPNAPSARLARVALRQDPTAVEALTVLGLQAQLRNDTGRARQLFGYSLRLSRRELQPRIWAIEEAVTRGDINGALRSYDIALRTSRSAPDMLFPVLASAVSEPKVRAGLVRIMATKPVWAQDFVRYLATSAPDPRPVVAFFQEAKGISLPVSESDRTTVVNALTSRGYFDEAWAYYATFRRSVDRRRSRDPDFARPADGAASFDWSTAQDARLAASILKRGNGGAVEFSAPPSIGGVVLQQSQLLPAGVYRLTGRSSDIAQPERSLPYWVLTCRDERELGRVQVPPSAEGNGAFAGSFTVPAGCPVQTLSLVVRPSDQIEGVTGEIDHVQLEPAQ